jgi:hypothetical protein
VTLSAGIFVIVRSSGSSAFAVKVMQLVGHI